MPDARQLTILKWYADHARPLPWRATTEPWAILVSETMAQQTQISRVVERYGPFMDRFPTPASMAGASPAEVLRLWSGLGYNRRGLRLQEAARYISENGWPQDLETLPGVGPYTAGAVGSISFGHEVPAVDTNVKRVLSRWKGKPLEGQHLQSYAIAVLPKSQAAQWNQAIMDLGAAVCTPQSPLCAACPAQTWCRDPAVYVPPPKQPSFRGSQREARGALLSALTRSPVPLHLSDIVSSTGLSMDRLAKASESLLAEGMVVKQESHLFALPL